jgi:hypothetical protein
LPTSQVFQDYKPLRNQLRQLNLQQSLEDIWLLARHLAGGIPLPYAFGDGRPHRILGTVHAWDLATFARELVLEASVYGTGRLNSFSSVAKLYNTVKDVEGVASKRYFEIYGRGLGTTTEIIFTTIHRQLPWQQKLHLNTLVRYLKIFGENEVEGVLQESSGLSVREWYFMGLAVAGHLSNNPGIDSKQDYASFGIPLARSQRFFQKLSLGIDELRERTRAAQRYDENWTYTWSPLEDTPLISLDPKHPTRLHCPLPELVLRRVSQGLFYDILKIQGYQNPFGRSFENYVGAVLAETFKHRPHQLLGEKAYQDGRNRKDGSDWIVVDQGASLFVEAKTKRLRQDAKLACHPTTVGGEIDILAKAIVQLYKNIADAQRGITQWVPDGKPVYPLVVTMEDWYLFGAGMAEKLKYLVLERLRAVAMDESCVETMPFTVMSSSELELVGSVIAQVGIGPFFRKKTSAEFSSWMPREFTREAFPEALLMAPRMLFSDTWDRVFPETLSIAELEKSEPP